MLYYQRKLPHWIPDSAVIFITWRLAGSAPPTSPEILTAQNTGRVPFAEQDRILDQTREGPFWLRDARIAKIVENALHYGENPRGLYILYAWVIMPNHVHVVFEPKTALPKVMRWLKGRTSRVANRILGRTGKPFWQDESYDHWIRSGKELQEVIAYVENNPAHANLVESAEQWLWSSAGRWQTTHYDRLPHQCLSYAPSFRRVIVVPYQSNEDAVNRQLVFEVEKRDDICIVHISGRLATGVDNDLLSLKAREVKNLGYCKIVADISKLEAIGSSGISFFVDLYTSTSKHADGCFVLAGAMPRVMEVLALTGLTGIMPMALDLAGGLAFCTRKETIRVGHVEAD